MCTTTSEFSQEPLPSFSHLLDYSPTSAEQPQPTDAILVPKGCMWDAKLSTCSGNNKEPYGGEVYPFLPRPFPSMCGRSGCNYH